MTADAVAQRFADPAAIANYAEGPPRFVPGFHDMHRMAAVLMAERAPPDARVLVLGAGGGLELRAFAAAQPGWRFDGVDPSAQMLDLARGVAADAMSRTTLHEGLIDAAPDGPFDAASALLVLHFLAPDERLATLRALHRRLKPGAPLIAVHSSFDTAPPQGGLWLDRYSAFALASGASSETVAKAREGIAAMGRMLPPEEDERLLAEAGFSPVQPFFAAFTWRGWAAYA